MIPLAADSRKPRILLWGDSLTEGRPGASYAAHLAELLPEFSLSNRGKGGDTVQSLLTRLESDPLPPAGRRAPVALLWVGVNDVYADLSPGYALWKTAMRQVPTRDEGQFDELYRSAVTALSHHARRLILVPPLFVGEDPGTELNLRLLDMGNRIRTLAERLENAEFLDIRPALPLTAVDPPRFLPVNPWQKLADSVGGGIEEKYYDRAAERRGLKWTYDGLHLNSLGASVVSGIIAAAVRRAATRVGKESGGGAMPPEAAALIESLNLEPHPEGGWYRSVFTTGEVIPDGSVPGRDSPRPCATSIYFLMTADGFSAFHRLKSSEFWYHHCGSPLDIEIIHPGGDHERRRIGPAVDGFDSQAEVPPGSWFASRVVEGGAWALVGCGVAPGFDFADFELADRTALIGEYPCHADLIRSLTREG